MGSPKLDKNKLQGHTVKETFYRAFKKSHFEDKVNRSNLKIKRNFPGNIVIYLFQDELLDIVYWLRQFVAVIIGM